MNMLLRDIHKTYRGPAGDLPVLQGIDLEICQTQKATFK